MVTIDNLVKGAKFKHRSNFGWLTSPFKIIVTIVHVSDLDVFYRIDNSIQVKQTPIDRFLEIVNK